MAETDRNENVASRSERARPAIARLSRAQVLRGVAGIAMVVLGLAAASGAGWAVATARETMLGRMALYAQYTPRSSMVHVGRIEIAENTP